MRISDWSSDVCSSDLKVTFAQIEKGATLDFDQAMIQEYRLSQAFMAGTDFYEGIRALLVDKDNRPRWSPARLAELTPALVESHLRPPRARDLPFSCAPFPPTRWHPSDHKATTQT